MVEKSRRTVAAAPEIRRIFPGHGGCAVRAVGEVCRGPLRRQNGPMKLGQLASTARDLFTAKLVYGDPVERDGTVVIPAAAVFGGGGGGAGDTEAVPVREGAGFGVLARPAGAFVIRGGAVTWVPAVDVTRLGLAAAVTVVALAKILARRAKP
jgi:uncharacterized spore protein YtfJ